MMSTINHTHSASTRQPALALSMPNLLLRVEALAFFIGAIALYANQGFSGVAFALLLLVPDVSMVGYLVNVTVGSRVYNIVHLYTLPVLLIAFGLATSTPLALQIGLIWFAHISMDRVAGYGLKYATDFKDTHFQHV
jgi:hypothetical protein